MSSKKITAIVADDEVDFCGIVRGLAKLRNLTFLPDAHDGEQSLTTILSHRPDIAVLDIQMPKLSGKEILNEIIIRKLETRVRLVTCHRDEDYFHPAYWSGAMGIVYKPDVTESYGPSDCIAQAFKALSYGLPYVSSTPLNAIRAQAPGTPSKQSVVDLSEMEWEVLSYLARGFSDKEIASMVDLSVKSVERRKHSLRRKLRVRSTSELVARAFESGIIGANHPPKK